jgi:hypothetical protein
MTAPTVFDLANRIVGGDLPAKLEEWRTEYEMSFDAIARRLHRDYDLEVTGEAIRSWWGKLHPAVDEAATS